jgi:hypothetical protein
LKPFVLKSVKLVSTATRGDNQMMKKKKEKDNLIKEYIVGETVGHILWVIISSPFRFVLGIIKHY